MCSVEYLDPTFFTYLPDRILRPQRFFFAYEKRVVLDGHFRLI